MTLNFTNLSINFTHETKPTISHFLAIISFFFSLTTTTQHHSLSFKYLQLSLQSPTTTKKIHSRKHTHRHTNTHNRSQSQNNIFHPNTVLLSEKQKPNGQEVSEPSFFLQSTTKASMAANPTVLWFLTKDPLLSRRRRHLQDCKLRLLRPNRDDRRH